MASTHDVNDGSGNVLSSTGTTTANLHPLGLNAHKYDIQTVVGDANYQLLPTDRYVVTSVAFTSAHTWFLPEAADVDAGWEITVADAAGIFTSGINKLTVEPPFGSGSTDTINGVLAGIAIPTIAGSYLRVRSDGVSNWEIIGASFRISYTTGRSPLSPTDGWIPSMLDDWSYNSATSFVNLSSDDTDTRDMRAGTRVKWTQGGNVKYGTVASVVAGTVTLITTTDYTIANSTITHAAYSNEASPVGYPTWFNWSPTIVGYSVNPTPIIYRWNAVGNALALNMSESPVFAASNAAAHTYSLPVNAASVGQWDGAYSAYDNATPKIGSWDIQPSGSVINVYGRVATVDNTAGGAASGLLGLQAIYQF